MRWTPRHPALRELISALLRETSPIYVVGGAVRDIFMGQETEPNDIDIVLEPPAAPVARGVADRLGWAFYMMDSARDVSRLLFTANAGEHLVVDVSAMQGHSIEADLRQRDFTVNAMAVALHRDGRSEIVDVLGGLRDLERGVLRAVSPLSLVDDAVRTLRAVRLQVQLGLRIDGSTRDQIARLAASIRFASPERIRDELWKMLATARAGQALRELRGLGLLMHVLPEADPSRGLAAQSHDGDGFERTVRAVEFACGLRDWLLARPESQRVPMDADVQAMLEPYCFRLRHLYQEPVAANRLRAEWLVWPPLFFESGAETTQRRVATNGSATSEQLAAERAGQRLTQLRFSRAEIMLVEKSLAEYKRPAQLHDRYAHDMIPRRARYRYFRQTDGRAFSYRTGTDALLLGLIDYRSSFRDPPAEWAQFLEHVGQLLSFAFEPRDNSATSAPLVDGHFLMKRLRITPGKQIGELLDYLMEAQAVGEIATEAEALQLASAWLNERN